MVEIGVIINKIYLNNKAKALIDYLKTRAEVSIYVEELSLIKATPRQSFNEDLMFVKGKGELILNMVKFIEKETSIPVINSYRGIWLAMNRFLNSTYLRKAGILIPDFSLTPDKEEAPFKDYIIKNIIDQKSSSFSPSIEIIDGHFHVSDKRALSEAEGGEESYHFFFYQKYVKSKWEFKIYGIGEKLKFYKRIPSINTPHEIPPKNEIEKIPQLEESVYKIMDTLNLKITSIDFLQSKDGVFYLTDVNSTPNFDSIPNGSTMVGEYLINQIKR